MPDVTVCSCCGLASCPSVAGDLPYCPRAGADDTGAPEVSGLAKSVAREVAWRGHMTDASIAAYVAETHPREDAAYVVSCAVSAGLIREVPRLGGYVATRAGDTAVFGPEFAEFVRS